jgi:5-dehydro-4-deoxyglucarate dehydratase
MAAIVAAGGTGEMYSLTPPRIWKSYGLWWRGGGPIPVISGTGFYVAIGVDLARQSARMGAGHAIPCYPNSDDEGLAECYAAIVSATPLSLFRLWPRLGESEHCLPTGRFS